MKEQKNKKQIVYIAIPYTHSNPNVMRLRYDMVTEYCARQTRKGFIVFSPITHSHSIATYGTPHDWNFWKQIDTVFLQSSVCLVVLRLSGWYQSVGVTAERQICEDLNLPTYFTDFNDDLDRVLPAALRNEIMINLDE